MLKSFGTLMKRFHIYVLVVVLVSSILLISYCWDNYMTDGISPSAQKVIALAGYNKYSLVKVLKHFQSPEDSLKLKAAEFLIENMPLYYSAEYRPKQGDEWLDKLPTRTYGSFDEAIKHFDEVGISFDLYDYDYDVKTIDSNFLIANIDNAFESWRGNSLSQFLSFENFCELILPYRISTEPLEDWRERVRETKVLNLDNFDLNTHLVKVANRINEIIIKQVRFQSRLSTHKRNFSQLLADKGGDCFDISHYTIFVMRSLGLPVTLDFTPAWGNNNGGHSWNTILTPNGDYSLFSEKKINDSLYQLYTVPSKVFRRTFKDQGSLLPKELKKISDIPRFMFKRNLVDVTDEYTQTSDFEITIEKEQIEHAFLGVFLKGEWKPIAYTLISNGKGTFQNITHDLLYRVLLLENDSLKAFEDVILFNGSNIQSRSFTPDHDNLIDIDMQFERKPDITWENFDYSFGVKDATVYTLSYWDKQWIDFDSVKSKDNMVTFKGVPSSTLYLMKKANWNNERPFLIQGDSIIWK